MPSIIVKNPDHDGKKIDEFIMIEIQGDIEQRDEEIKDCSNNFVGDLLYNKYGSPILIIGHHILYGKEKKLDKPFAVIEKVEKSQDASEERKFDESIINESQPNVSFSILDTTVNIENRTKVQVEYHVKAFIKKKLVFNSRPRPIISNLPKTN